MDPIPVTDEGFDGFQTNFMTVLTPIATSLGIPDGKMTDLTALQEKWKNAYAIGGKSHKTTREMPDTKKKTDAREAYENGKAPNPMGLRTPCFFFLGI